VNKPSGYAFVIAALLCVTADPSVAREGGFRFPPAELLRSDGEQIAVRIRFPAPRTGTRYSGSSLVVDLTIPGLPRTSVPGEPSLPFRTVLLTVPPSAEFILQIDDPRATRMAGRPAPFVQDDLGGVALPFVHDPSGAAANVAQGDSPQGEARDPVEVRIDGYLRERRVVQLVFHPLTADPEGKGTIYHPELTARLVFTENESRLFRSRSELDVRTGRDGDPATRGAAERVIRDEFYRSIILNEASVDPEAYREAVRPVPSPGEAENDTAAAIVVETAGVASGGAPLAAKIPVKSEGIWSVSYADLVTAGIDPAGTPIGSVSLRAGGVDLPVSVIDGGDGLFGSGDRVEFHGVGISGNPETEADIYRLAFDETGGIAMPTRGAAPAGGTSPVSFLHTERFEINERLFTSVADGEGDHFGWDRVIQSSSGFRDFPDPVLGEPFNLITLPGLDPAATTVHLRARVYHLGGASHTTDLSLNGTALLDSEVWTSPDVTHEVDTAVTNLMPANTVRLWVSGPSFNQVLLNWIEFDYLRLFQAVNDELAFTVNLAAPVAHQVAGFTTPDIVVYDITDHDAPVLLSGVQVAGSSGSYTASFTDTLGGSRRFLARAGVALPGGAILVDHPSNLQDPSNGADLMIVAHRDFLSALDPLVIARTNEGMRVSLIDVEDAFDEFSFGRAEAGAIRDLVATAFGAWQAPPPSFLLLVGNATLDPRQLMSGSVPPLMPTGTFQAPTLGLASTDNYFVTVAGSDPLPDLVVGRIPAQTALEVSDAVSRIIAYASIDPDILNQQVLLVADNDQPTFEAIQEDVVSLQLSGTRIPATRAYLRLLGTNVTTQTILSTINQGALAGSYLGHGNIHNWAAEDIFLDSVHVPQLTNADRPPFLSTLNCINGLHAGPRAPNVSSLAEQILLSPTGGAIGVWSPAALASLVDYQEMSDILFRQLFTDRVQTLGLAATAAKIEAFVSEGVAVENLEAMTYFGDPTVVLRVDGDRDGLTDAAEDGCACGLLVRDADSDDDGLVDGDEQAPSVDSDGDGVADPLDPDADDDGLPDGLEAGVVVADQDTDTTAGVFLPDMDPLTTTDPAAWDTDGGGAPDGAEDRNADGAVSAGETDPNNPVDDQVCGPSPLPELQNLMLTVNGADLVLSWDGIEAQDPCVLYRVLEADPGPPPVTSLPAFASRKVVPGATAILPGEAAEPALRWYLVVATRPDVGDGPTGH